MLFGGTVGSFEANLYIEVDATADLFEKYRIEGINKGSDWEISVSSLGDETGMVFDITSGGQVTYDNTAYAGFVSGIIKFKVLGLGN